MFSALAVFGHVIGWLGILTSLYGAYFVILAVWGEVRKRKASIKARPSVTRFALVVPARNEEAVIGNLINSLQQQNYPADLYTIYIAPNNCTDNTHVIAAAQGAEIFNPFGEIRTKGDVLSQFVKKYMYDKRYDAICVFDADNVVHSDFLQKMNNARLAGAHIAQGFKDSKNPLDSAVALSYSIYYWIIGRFYNASREVLNLSGFVMGTGYMVTTAFLEKIGGWNTKTISEDYEFTAQCVLAGERVHYVSGAIVYDEQPLTFGQSWKQRRRWSTGAFECSRYYLKDLLKQSVRRKCRVCFDVAVTYMGPILFIISLIAAMSQAVVRGSNMHVYSLQLLSAVLLAGILLFILLAVCIEYKSTRRTLRGFGIGASSFGLLLLSWTVINIVTIVKKKRKWEVIAHTRAITIRDEVHHSLRRTVHER
ncbi:glycosyltransferase family 2 protein [Paenibacillus hemerocallicola]|nr:glycosyltransferase family 2 protein [Paenibacillus hemerocallicola]